MKARRKVRALLVTALLGPTLAVAPGCSIFISSKQELKIVPSEPNADVYLNGDHVGTGPTTLKVRRGEDYSVLAKVGERAATAKVGRKISITGVMDLIGGFVLLIPFLGAFSPGFWDLNPNQVSLVLPPPVRNAAPPPYRAAPAAAAQPTLAPQQGGTSQRPGDARPATGAGSGQRGQPPADSTSRLPARRTPAR